MKQVSVCALCVVFCLALTSVSEAKKITKKTKSTNYPATGLYVNGTGNSVDQSAVMQMVNASSTSLDIEIYTMEDANFRQAIENALTRGVSVTIIKEPNPVDDKCAVFSPPTSGEPAYCPLERQLFSDIQAAGGKVVPFNKTNLCGTATKYCVEHGKMVIVDKVIAMISTGNFDPTSLCDASEDPSQCDRDYSVITDDSDVVGAVNQIFAKDLVGNKYDLSSILTPTVAAKLTVSPLSMQPIVDFIQSAKTSIMVQNQYLDDPTMNAALVQAAESGVDVSIMVSSECAFGKPSKSVVADATKTFQEFDQAGIQSTLFTGEIKIGGKSGYLHAKTMIVDGTSAWVGSVNGSTEALSTNREFGLFITDQSEIAPLSQVMAADAVDPGAESWQQSLECSKDKNSIQPNDLRSLLSLNSI